MSSGRRNYLKTLIKYEESRTDLAFARDTDL